jgi:cytosine/adenosine deaminase-related metal-dependent hydrolase
VSTLITAAYVLPVSSPPIRNGAVLVGADGRIADVGAADLIAPANAKRIDLGEAALLPGLINVHAHPELSVFRGQLDDLPFHEWIPTLMRCKRAANLTPEDYEVAARWSCVEVLRSGQTTVAATEPSGAALSAFRTAGLRGRVYLETFGPAAAQVDESLSDLRARLDALAPQTNDLLGLGISPHAPYTVSDALYIAAGGLARVESLPLAAHVAESEAEQLLVRAGAGPFAAGLRTRGIATPQRGHSTIELLARLGVLDCKPLLIHCVQIDHQDLRLIADSGAAIAHCPVANARLGHGIAPIIEARAAGVRVGLGTDSVASNNRLDLLEEARCAQIVQRARLRSSGALPGAELIRLVTIDGARALGIDARVGTIERGKDADLCAVRLDRPHTIPAGKMENALFHAARGGDVVLTMVQGRVLFDGEVRTLNETDLATRVRAIAERLRCARNEAS